MPGPATARGQDTEKDQQDQEKADQPNLEDWWGGESPSILKEGDQGAVGDRGFDFNQKARGSGAGVRSGH